jgi:hypothetical protein
LVSEIHRAVVLRVDLALLAAADANRTLRDHLAADYPAEQNANLRGGVHQGEGASVTRRRRRRLKRRRWKTITVEEYGPTPLQQRVVHRCRSFVFDAGRR